MQAGSNGDVAAASVVLIASLCDGNSIEAQARAVGATVETRTSSVAAHGPEVSLASDSESEQSVGSPRWFSDAVSEVDEAARAADLLVDLGSSQVRVQPRVTPEMSWPPAGRNAAADALSAIAHSASQTRSKSASLQAITVPCHGFSLHGVYHHRVDEVSERISETTRPSNAILSACRFSEQKIARRTERAKFEMQDTAALFRDCIAPCLPSLIAGRSLAVIATAPADNPLDSRRFLFAPNGLPDVTCRTLLHVVKNLNAEGKSPGPSASATAPSKVSVGASEAASKISSAAARWSYDLHAAVVEIGNTPNGVVVYDPASFSGDNLAGAVALADQGQTFQPLVSIADFRALCSSYMVQETAIAPRNVKNAAQVAKHVILTLRVTAIRRTSPIAAEPPAAGGYASRHLLNKGKATSPRNAPGSPRSTGEVAYSYIKFAMVILPDGSSHSVSSRYGAPVFKQVSMRMRDLVLHYCNCSPKLQGCQPWLNTNVVSQVQEVQKVLTLRAQGAKSSFAVTAENGILAQHVFGPDGSKVDKAFVVMWYALESLTRSTSTRPSVRSDLGWCR